MIDGTKRRHYGETFKQRIVQELLKSGMPVSSFAAANGINRTNLQKWKKIYGHEFTTVPVAADGTAVGINEFVSLKKEFDSLKETVDNLRTVVKKNLENKYSDG